MAWPLWLCCQEDEKARKGQRQRINGSFCRPPCKAHKDEAIQGLPPFFSPTATACLMWRPQPTSQKDREKDKAGPGHLPYCPLRPCGWLLVGTGPSFRDNGTSPKQRQAGERPRLRGLNTPNSNSSFFYVLYRTQRCFPLSAHVLHPLSGEDFCSSVWCAFCMERGESRLSCGELP